MTQQTKNRSENQTFGSRQAYRPTSTTKGRIIKIVLVIVFLLILVGVIRVVRYTKQNLPPSTALLPVPTETLEGHKEAGDRGESEKVRK